MKKHITKIMVKVLTGIIPVLFITTNPGLLFAGLITANDGVLSAEKMYVTEKIGGYLVTAPNGSQLWVDIIQPKASSYPNAKFPAIISVAPGTAAGELAEGDEGIGIAVQGFVEVHFNLEGRGRIHLSEGVEDFGGYVHQDDLKAIIRYTSGLPNVDVNNIGVLSGSYGLVTASGCLGRFNELAVKYFIDSEGPTHSFIHVKEAWYLDNDASNDTPAIQAAKLFGHVSIQSDNSAENVAFWRQRDPMHFIKLIKCYYMRIQNYYDHAQPPSASGQFRQFDLYPAWYNNKHAVEIINAAVDGTAKEVYVNRSYLGNIPGATYSYRNPPIYYENFSAEQKRAEGILCIKEMANLP